MPGYEALLRMEDRDGQLINPGLFMESAEQFGLAASIDYRCGTQSGPKNTRLD